MAEVAMGTLYDVNKSAMEGLSALSRNQIKRALTDKVGEYVKDTDNTYYMLLCNETRDYTVFRLSELDNLSAMPLIENEKFYCYYFFPYDSAVLQF